MAKGEDMRKIDVRIIIGALLIGAGILFLLQTFDIIPNAWNVLWTISFLTGSGIFFYVYFTDRTQWWSLIPAMTLLGLAGTIFVGAYLPAFSYAGAAIFLGGLGFSFLIIYLTNQDFWWAIIPGGVLVTLAIVTIADHFITGDSGAGIFFMGLSITFVILALLGKPKHNFWWAYIPAGVLFVMGVFFISPIQPLVNIIWPVALIILGGVLLWRNFRKT
jgi:hypothetical protein